MRSMRWSRSMRSAWIEIRLQDEVDQLRAASRSMRSAWIEIAYKHFLGQPEGGRAPCGARGLKCNGNIQQPAGWMSRSMRSAWIEIICPPRETPLRWVALHAERVD